MNVGKSIVKVIIAKNIRIKLLSLHQNFTWSCSYPKYLALIDKEIRPDRPLLEKLIYAWGNQGFSAKLDYLERCLDYAFQVDGPIFECGSGLTTLLLAPIAQKRSIPMISVEHMHEWAERVKGELSKFELTADGVIISSLVNYETFDWYDISGLAIDHIKLCICDAPPGDTRGGRAGFLHLFQAFLEAGSVILVDDTIRISEQKMIEEWKRLLPLHVEYCGKDFPYAVLTVLEK